MTTLGGANKSVEWWINGEELDMDPIVVVVLSLGIETKDKREEIK